jgi:hypothetical protein
MGVIFVMGIVRGDLFEAIFAEWNRIMRFDGTGIKFTRTTNCFYFSALDLVAHHVRRLFVSRLYQAYAAPTQQEDHGINTNLFHIVSFFLGAKLQHFCDICKKNVQNLCMCDLFRTFAPEMQNTK